MQRVHRRAILVRDGEGESEAEERGRVLRGKMHSELQLFDGGGGVSTGEEDGAEGGVGGGHSWSESNGALKGAAGGVQVTVGVGCGSGLEGAGCLIEVWGGGSGSGAGTWGRLPGKQKQNAEECGGNDTHPELDFSGCGDHSSDVCRANAWIVFVVDTID